MKDIRLYINDKLCDLEEEIQLPLNYQLESFENPTVTKVGWSKTISLKGTNNNNKIFGGIYKLDRMQHYAEITGGNEFTGINFNPSIRTPFSLYLNADLVESGYMQLNDISIVENEVNYNITLYSGLADFFYGLKYNEDGTAKTLADLRYFIKENGTVLSADDEFNFTINKNLVYNGFFKDWTTDNDELLDFLTFIPAYNGVYSDFDSSHCLINTNGASSTIFPTSIIEDNTTYTTLNGYGLASLNEDYTEWQMKDLRSYHQRPALKVSKLIETICREENSGYTVNFDSTFFNSRNPYWSKSFIALPLLTSNEYEQSSTDFSSITQYVDGNAWFANKNGTIQTSTNVMMNVNGADVTSSNGIIDLSNIAVGATVNLKAGFQIVAHPTGATEDKLYLGYLYRSGYVSRTINQVYTVYLTAIDADTNQELGHSTAYQIQTNDVYVGGERLIYQPSNGAAVTVITGCYFQKVNNGYQLCTSSGNNTLSLAINDCTIADHMKIQLHIEARSHSYTGDTDFQIGPSMSGTDKYPYYCNVSLVDMSGSLTDSENISTGKTFTKSTFLKTEKTPADYLLDYCKLFGLYFIKDIQSKTVDIVTRNTFFTGDVKDWSDRIDYSKDRTITPILFDKKYYRLALEVPDTKWSKRYYDQYSQDYGQQRISTGYNFNYETTNFYEDNLYQVALPAIDSNKYYRSFYTTNEKPVPAFLNDNVSYELFNDEDDDSATVDIYGSSYINSAKTVEWSRFGQDCWAKSAFFSGDYDLEEISNALVIYNGVKALADSNGNYIDFWITDDVSEMLTTNEQVCFLYTESEYSADNERIAIKVNSLPQYLNCLVDSSNNVINSFDFGMPKEIYFGNYSYPESATIYYNFWKQFYTDQFDIDTKKLTCYVKLDIMNQDYLRDFYWFGNSIWILNKVSDYDPCSESTVQCEFVKCSDMGNYTGGQTTY